ncbi:CbtB-domain containing protein [Nostocaceae cyanobacterium CENA369]|uniref:CbtB-domain containing protein n=1 Tax=Dendronalium phyllosphericum CENA369 TaxID=1725256 RepID=A0A8J7LGC4_9NOST|nr:CbtB-domain containing protein [Dendronalium phyllosphericum]MBH8572874.1 CbtB-domain containing protein [Dendronalium phyllosphericum CENA369]
MTVQSSSSIQQQVTRRVLSVPVQSALYVGLCSLTLWTIYFSTYPAIHDTTHTLRHHTLMVSCH